MNPKLMFFGIAPQKVDTFLHTTLLKPVNGLKIGSPVIISEKEFEKGKSLGGINVRSLCCIGTNNFVTGKTYMVPREHLSERVSESFLEVIESIDGSKVNSAQMADIIEGVKNGFPITLYFRMGREAGLNDFLLGPLREVMCHYKYPLEGWVCRGGGCMDSMINNAMQCDGNFVIALSFIDISNVAINFDMSKVEGVAVTLHYTMAPLGIDAFSDDADVKFGGTFLLSNHKENILTIDGGQLADFQTAYAENIKKYTDSFTDSLEKHLKWKKEGKISARPTHRPIRSKEDIDRYFEPVRPDEAILNTMYFDLPDGQSCEIAYTNHNRATILSITRDDLKYLIEGAKEASTYESYCLKKYGEIKITEPQAVPPPWEDVPFGAGKIDVGNAVQEDLLGKKAEQIQPIQYDDPVAKLGEGGKPAATTQPGRNRAGWKKFVIDTNKYGVAYDSPPEVNAKYPPPEVEVAAGNAKVKFGYPKDEELKVLAENDVMPEEIAEAVIEEMKNEVEVPMAKPCKAKKASRGKKTKVKNKYHAN